VLQTTTGLRPVVSDHNRSAKVMKRVTLIPTPAMIAIVGFLVVAVKFGVTSASVRPLVTLLLLLLPFLALLEIAAFAYDIRKREDRILSRSFVPRLVIHVVGVVLAAYIILLTIIFVRMGPINPG